MQVRRSDQLACDDFLSRFSAIKLRRDACEGSWLDYELTLPVLPAQGAILALPRNPHCFQPSTRLPTDLVPDRSLPFMRSLDHSIASPSERWS